MLILQMYFSILVECLPLLSQCGVAERMPVSVSVAKNGLQAMHEIEVGN